MSVHHGDALEWLRAMPDASADAVVTDPPYGISFMSKAWDSFGGAKGMSTETRQRQKAEEQRNEPFGRSGVALRQPGAREAFIAWFTEIAAEMLRVLKPGGWCVVATLPRVVHWPTTALEDAGFELRDMLSWWFGQGFPKSLDVSKAIDSRKDWASLRSLQRAVKDARECLGITQSEAARRAGMIGPDESLGGGGFMWFETGMRVPSREQWPALKKALQLGDEFDGAFDAAEREVTGNHQGDMGGFGGTRCGKSDGDITAPSTEAAKLWQGWGTALKPACEFMVLARKPMAETVAANVLEHGTGVLNVDGCRVGTDAGWSYPHGKGGSPIHEGGHKNVACEATAGRWPPHLLLTHAVACGGVRCVEGCPVRELDRQSGPQKDGTAVRHRGIKPSSFGSGGKLDDLGYAGDGGASRFFPRFRYTAKPSRSEREAGLEHLPLRSAKKFNEGGIQGRRDAQASEAIADAETHSQGLDARGRTLIREDGTKTLVDRFIPQHRANIHPTVKPVDLMRWLVRLITPKGGLVLDPFTGSGTTGVACAYEGARFSGCEQMPFPEGHPQRDPADNPDYVSIARARIAHAKGEGPRPTEPLGNAAAPTAQMGLFGA